MLIRDKDSILKRYLTIIDTLPYYDTTTNEYKILRAYNFNDTGKLKTILEYTKGSSRKPEWEINMDSCVKQTAFKDLKSEEAYRFNYSAAFCPFHTSATIAKYKDSIILETIVYQHAWDTTPCKVIGRTSIDVDSLSWAKFQESLTTADLWGLKRYNERRGADGDNLDIYGFRKGTNAQWNPDKSTFVSRWDPASTPILDCFVLLLKYSKTKKGCLTAR